MITLNVEKREKVENPYTLREHGFLPAVFYGTKTPSTSIKIKESDFLKVWSEAGESTVVKLNLGSDDFETLIHEVAIHPVTDSPRHVDFYVFEKGQKMEVTVQLEFTGVSTAVKDLGGVLVKVLYEIEVEALPSKLPSEIEVDISKLTTFESQIHASDLILPEGVELMIEPNEVVALVEKPREEEPDEVEATDISDIEVEKKGKQDEEGEGEGESSSDSGEKKDASQK